MTSAPHSMAATPTPASHDPSARIERHLLAWQESGDDAHLEVLVANVMPLAEQVAKAALQRRGFHDPSAVDETISLILDHLRRLPGVAAGERTVARFVPRSDDRCHCSTSDPGRAYILWLVKERAADVARMHRRHGKHATVFSMLDERLTGRLQDCRASGDAGCDPIESPAGRSAHLHDAIQRLPSRERLLIELLLDGKSQAAISHVLEVCEGTVSRLRVQAIARLRNLLAE